MIRLVEHDFFKSFWDLNPWMIVLINVLVSIVRFYFWELYMSKDPLRPPYGLSGFRWASVTFGDGLFITVTLLIMREYYQRVTVPDAGSFWTSSLFSALCILGGFLLSVAYSVLMASDFRLHENLTQANFDHVTHFIYVSVIAALLLGFLRTPFYGQEHQLWVSAFLVFFGGYGFTVFLDRMNWNPLWRLIDSIYHKNSYIP